MRFLNEYFFGEEEIHISDGIWFYGISAGAIVLTVFVVFKTW